MYTSNILPTFFILTILRVFVELGQLESVFASKIEKHDEFANITPVEVLDQKSEESFKQQSSLNGQTLNEINEEIENDENDDIMDDQ